MCTKSALKLAFVLLVFLIPTLLFPKPSLGAPGHFGPSDGIADLGYNTTNCPPGATCLKYIDNFVAMNALGIFPNIAAYSAPDHDPDALAQDGTCLSTNAQSLAYLVSTLPSIGPVPYILDLTSVIFGTVTPRTCACDKNPTCYNSVNANTWYVRSDYQTRLNNFKATAGSFINSSTVSGIVLHSELANANGAVTDPTTVNTLAAAIKALWPGIPVIGGYPTSATLGGGSVHQYGMAYAPLSFPTGLDVILSWDYSVTDPTASTFTTMYNDTSYGFYRRLRWYQQIIYVAPSWNQSATPTCPATFAINGERFDLLARSWCAWALELNTSRTTTLLNFYWGQLGSVGGTQDGAQKIISWEKANCGGTALEPAFISVANAAATGSSCWE